MSNSISRRLELVGRVALCTQGALYLMVGLLALQVGFGDRGKQASQEGALAAVARQPFGKALLIVFIVGLAAYALWRIGLAIRGEEDDDEDGQSALKRAANIGRAAIYLSFMWFAIQLVMGSKSSKESGSGGSGGSGGGAKEKSTAIVLDWPAGRWIVVAAGLVVAGVAVWNFRKAFKRKFLDHLDLHDRTESQRSAIEFIGVAGYSARGLVYALVAWFLIQAGLNHDADKTQGLDGALSKLAEHSYGTWLLAFLAAGLFLFGTFRILDGLNRRTEDITYS